MMGWGGGGLGGNEGDEAEDARQEAEAEAAQQEVREAEERLLGRQAGEEARGEPDHAAEREQGGDEGLAGEARLVEPGELGPEAEAERRLLAEERRLNDAAERTRTIEELQPEKWQKLSDAERKDVLDSVGDRLSEAYHHPKPPLAFEKMPEPELQGQFGYYFDERGRPVGDRIEMNLAAEVEHRRALDDARESLLTYAEEWRHSYQVEQARLYMDPQFQRWVDDPDKAKEWAENLKDYKGPEEDEDAYRSQPVEKDGTGFADEVGGRVYRK